MAHTSGTTAPPAHRVHAVAARHGPRLLGLLVDTAAAYRLTRLVTADVIGDGPRNRLVRWAYLRRPHHGLSHGAVQQLDQQPNGWAEEAMADEHTAPKLATLVTCRWCTGVWVAAGVVAARRLVPAWWAPVADGLAVAAAAALIAGLEG